ncbi:MAG: DnaJ domain-containing protein [Planctomycetes bacterium]|nr:DnaJ domain-containing protein [Planctomycetota bacterium]
MTGRDPYEVLGVGREASDEAIRDAYFRLVRVHSPEDSPERFQAISDAYAVLSDAEQRKSLDDSLGFPADVVDALRQAEALRESDPDRAVAVVTALLRAPRPPAVRWVIAVFCLGVNRPAVAIPMLEALVQFDPASADYEHALGDALLRAGRRDAAERHLRAAVALDPERRGAYLSICEIQESAGAIDLALRTLREALSTGRGGGARVGLADLGVLLQMFTVLVNAGRHHELERVLVAVRHTVPDGDGDAARHVALRLASLSDRFADARRFHPAHLLMAEADTIAPHPEMHARAALLATYAAAQRQADDAARDAGVPVWIKSILAAHFAAAMATDAFDQMTARVADGMSRSLPKADAEWAAFERRYASAAAHVSETRTAARSAAVLRVRRLSRGRTPRTESQPVSPMLRSLGFTACALVWMLVRTSCRDRDPPPPDAWRTLLPPTPHRTLSEDELNEAMRAAEILRAASSRQGRPLTVDEMVDALRASRDAPKPVVIDEPIRLDDLAPREGSTPR